MSVNRENAKQMIARMAFNHSEAVNNLLASMPIREIPSKRTGRPKSFEKLMIVKQKISMNQLILLLNRSVIL
jgi:hypothetical protein